jgi:hypothetical protein
MTSRRGITVSPDCRADKHCLQSASRVSVPGIIYAMNNYHNCIKKTALGASAEHTDAFSHAVYIILSKSKVVLLHTVDGT